MYQLSYFNPHFREGSDSSPNICSYANYNFNPHFREGSDYKGDAIARDGANFNPHFREGSDEDNADKGYLKKISIHTSAKEVTLGRKVV